MPGGPERQPTVAVLIAICGDFDEVAADAVVRHDYGPFRVYLCDDSEDQECRRRVDMFQSRYPGIVSVVRREVVAIVRGGGRDAREGRMKRGQFIFRFASEK